MKYKIISFLQRPKWGSQKDKEFLVMRDGLRRSVGCNAPEAELVIIEDHSEFVNALDACHRKVREWAVQCCKSYVPCACLDIDCLVLQDLSPIFENTFDLGMTVRDDKQWLNAGVIYYQPSDQARRDMIAWAELSRDSSRDKKIESWYRQETGQSATNEASFAYGLKHKVFQGRVKKFQCREWNCEQHYWEDMDENTKVLHVKSGLRGHVFNVKGKYPHFRPERARMAIARVEEYYGL